MKPANQGCGEVFGYDIGEDLQEDCSLVCGEAVLCLACYVVPEPIVSKSQMKRLECQLSGKEPSQ